MIRPVSITIDYEQPNTLWSLDRITTLDENGEEVRASYKVRVDYCPRTFSKIGDDARGREYGTFRFTLTDSAGKTLIAGERLRLSLHLLRRFEYDKTLPVGRFRVYETFDYGREPSRGMATEVPVDGRDIGPTKRIRIEYIYPP